MYDMKGFCRELQINNPPDTHIELQEVIWLAVLGKPVKALSEGLIGYLSDCGFDVYGKVVKEDKLLPLEQYEEDCFGRAEYHDPKSALCQSCRSLQSCAGALRSSKKLSGRGNKIMSTKPIDEFEEELDEAEEMDLEDIEETSTKTKTKKGKAKTTASGKAKAEKKPAAKAKGKVKTAKPAGEQQERKGRVSAADDPLAKKLRDPRTGLLDMGRMSEEIEGGRIKVVKQSPGVASVEINKKLVKLRRMGNKINVICGTKFDGAELQGESYNGYFPNGKCYGVWVAPSEVKDAVLAAGK